MKSDALLSVVSGQNATISLRFWDAFAELSSVVGIANESSRQVWHPWTDKKSHPAAEREAMRDNQATRLSGIGAFRVDRVPVNLLLP